MTTKTDICLYQYTQFLLHPPFAHYYKKAVYVEKQI